MSAKKKGGIKSVKKKAVVSSAKRKASVATAASILGHPVAKPGSARSKNGAGPIKVNGNDYNGVMPPVTLNDEQISQVLTYVRNEWGNTGEIVTVDEVRKVRAESAHQ